MDVILIPWRGGDTSRERNLHFVLDWYRGMNLPVTLADADSDKPFNRGASRNAAAQIAGDWDTALVADADCVADPNVIWEAFRVARETGTMVLPHDDFWRLSERGTHRLIADPDHYRAHPGDILDLSMGTRLQQSMMPSGALVITRASFEAIGGYADIPFWGFEDSLLLIEAKEAVGVTRLPGYLWHLWHPRTTGTIDDRTQAREIADRHLADRRASRLAARE